MEKMRPSSARKSAMEIAELMGLAKVSKKGDSLIVEIDTKEQPILVKSESCRAAPHASRFFSLCVTDTI